MKALTTAVIAAAVLFSSFTAAEAKSAKTLSSTMVGNWCFADQNRVADTITTFYARGKCAADPKGVNVFATGYSGEHYKCIFQSIEALIGKSEAYAVRAKCLNTAEGDTYFDNSMFQLIGGQLIITPEAKP